MSAWAKPGVKCVKYRTYTPPQFRHIKFRQPHVRIPINEIVTIVGTATDPTTGVLVLLIKEYPNTNNSGRDCGWWIGNFRPLITKTQEEDVALFRPLLTGLPVKEPV